MSKLRLTAVALLLLIVGLVIAGRPSPSHRTVIVTPGDDIQALVDDSTPGTRFVLLAGVHRLQQIEPKDGMTFKGRPGAVLSGARLLSDFRQEDGIWVAADQTQEGFGSGYCEDGSNDCQSPDRLYLDDIEVDRVWSRDDLEPGTWFFDYDADRVYLDMDPAGHQVELTLLEHAFRSQAVDVTIKGFVIEKYATPAQRGAVHAENTTGWRIEDNEIRWNHAAGVYVGSQTVVKGNDIHENGQLGLRGEESSDILIENNRIADNNTAGFLTGWEAGGAKFLATTSLTVRDNRVTGNYGTGLWTDYDNLATLYEDNVVSGNASRGIFHETSYDAVISGNVVAGNGRIDDVWLWGGQIVLANSSNVEVYDNEVTVAADAGDGIALIQVERGSGRYGPHLTEDNRVHDNTIRHLGTTGQTGAGGPYRIAELLAGNQFSNNHYFVPDGAAALWEWNGATDWNGFLAQGQESSGILSIIP